MKANLPRLLGRSVNAAFLLLALTLVLVPTANAQLSTASITGTVKDPSGAVIPNAEVNAIQTQTQYKASAVSDAVGFFALRALPIGPYELEVKAAGFSTYKQTGILLSVNQAANLQIALSIGSLTEVVSISADASAIDTTTSNIQRVIGSQEVSQLPLNGRNPANLIFTVSGVSNPVSGAGGAGTTAAGMTVLAGGATFPTSTVATVHGVRSGDVFFSLDGATNVDPFQVTGGPFPNPDATEEFNVVTGTYGARYPSAPGGAVNIVTRSGTNEIHGSFFEFLRNGYFNARNAFAQSPDVLKRNQYGIALGAPIQRDRWFVFGSWQGTQLSNSISRNAYFPTDAQRTGDFSTSPRPVRNPLTFQPFPGNIIPPSQLSQVNQQLLEYIPHSPNPDGYLEWRNPVRQHANQYVIKSDYTLGSHRFFARYFYDSSVTDSILAPPDNIMIGGLGMSHGWHNGTLGYTYTNANLVNDLRFTVMNYHNTPGDRDPNAPSLAKFGAKITEADMPGIFQQIVSGSFTAAYNGTADDPQRRIYDLSENLTITKGNHTISFGVEVQRLHQLYTSFSGQNPLAVYGGVFGPPTADFMMGRPVFILQSDGIYSETSGSTYGFYFEDMIRVTQRLNITAGVRWDPFWPFEAAGGRILCWSPDQESQVFTNAPAGLIYAGDSGCNSSGMDSTVAIIQPRIGAAYQLGSSGRTSIRAGYGIYSQQVPMQAYFSFGASEPFMRTVTYQLIPSQIDDPYARYPGGNPFASGFQLDNEPRPSNAPFSAIPTGTAFNRDFQPASIQQWSLSIQQALTKTDVIEVAYFGTSAAHLSMLYSMNTPVYIPGSSTIQNEQQRRPYPNLGTVTEMGSDGNSIYHGVEVSYKRRFFSGVMFNSSFNFSKSIDDGSLPAMGLSQISTPSPSLDHEFRRALSDFDQTFTWRTTAAYSTPALQSWNAFARQVLGSWSFNGILSVESGLPFGIVTTTDNSRTGLNSDFADRVPDAPLYIADQSSEERVEQAFNTAAFVPNAIGTFGNAGRNILRSSGLFNIDLGLSKDFVITERWKVVFRTESFNLLNHTNYLSPGNSLGAPTYGKIRSARDPRILQFSLRVAF
jgi:hypothetical protein